MKRLLFAILLTLTLLTASVSADAIATVRGFNYINPAGLIFTDGRPLYFGTGTGPLAGVYTADVKLTPDGTNLVITGSGGWNFGGSTGAFILPSGTFTVTNGAVVAANKSITYLAGTGGLDASLGTGAFKTSSGANTLSGDVTVAAGKSLTGAAGAGSVDFGSMSGTFASPTGANTLSGDVTVAAGKNLAGAAGTGNVNFGSMTGTFASPTGANTLSGDVTVAAGKNLTGAAGAGNVDFGSMTGTFKTPTGLHTFGGKAEGLGLVDDGELTFGDNEEVSLKYDGSNLKVSSDVVDDENIVMFVSVQTITTPEVADTDDLLNDAVLNETENVYDTMLRTLNTTRCLVVDPAANYVGTITIYGTDIADNEISEDLVWSTGHDAKTTDRAFKTITNVTAGARTGNGDTTFDMGVTNKMGLNKILASTSDVLKIRILTTDDTIAGITVNGTDIAKNTVTFTSAFNGAENAYVYTLH